MVKQIETGAELFGLVRDFATIALMSVGIYDDAEAHENGKTAHALLVGGEVVAYAVMTARGEVSAIETHPAHQRHGYAAQLIRAIGATSGALITNGAAARLFESLDLPYFGQA
jgi:GNAT superfamily N-acetyltransferase